MKKFIVVIIACLLLFAGCSSNEEPKQTQFAQNEKVEFDGARYSVQFMRKSSGGQWNTPDAGNEYVIVGLRIENISDKNKSYNPFDWKMQNSQGVEDSQTFYTTGTMTDLNSGELVPGGSVEGIIVFEQPIDDTGLQLNYYSSMFNDKYSFQIAITDESQPPKTLFNQTEIANLNNIEYSITKVQRLSKVGYSKPDNGNEYILITMKLKNNHNVKISHNSYDWKIQNSSGQEIDTAYLFSDSIKTFEYGDLLPGGTYEAVLAYEVKKGESSLVLTHYSSDFYSDEPTVQFTLK